MRLLFILLESTVSDLPESVQHFGVKVPEKPPNPPPLPAKQSPTFHQFPQLDLAADMSFDFGLGSELEGILGNNSNSGGEESTAVATSYSSSGPINVIGSIGNISVNGIQGMDVDLEDDVDVQDWLDSLVVPINTKLHPDLSSQYKEKKGEMNNWAHGVWAHLPPFSAMYSPGASDALYLGSLIIVPVIQW